MCAELKDSGNRKQFATGAVRDIHAGKGRMDLIPGAAMAMLMQVWGRPMPASNGSGPIGPNETLLFVVDLTAVK